MLERAQRLGLLGRGPVEAHVAHSEALSGLVGVPPGSFLDLGSGGGVPGLVLALRWPEARGALLDAARRRAEHLRWACARLSFGERVEVIAARAEDAARGRWRGTFELVVARGFGPPAVTAECAVGFLAPGGRLVVSEPPGGAPARWDRAGLDELGLEGPTVRTAGKVSAVCFVLPQLAADRWPRRTGVPERRPLWPA